MQITNRDDFKKGGRRTNGKTASSRSWFGCQENKGKLCIQQAKMNLKKHMRIQVKHSAHVKYCMCTEFAKSVAIYFSRKISRTI